MAELPHRAWERGVQLPREKRLARGLTHFAAMRLVPAVDAVSGSRLVMSSISVMLVIGPHLGKIYRSSGDRCGMG